MACCKRCGDGTKIGKILYGTKVICSECNKMYTREFIEKCHQMKRAVPINPKCLAGGKNNE